MSNTSFTVKELKERFDDGELDLSLSTLTEDDIPIKQMKASNHSGIVVAMSWL